MHVRLQLSESRHVPSGTDHPAGAHPSVEATQPPRLAGLGLDEIQRILTELFAELGAGSGTRPCSSPKV